MTNLKNTKPKSQLKYTHAELEDRINDEQGLKVPLRGTNQLYTYVGDVDDDMMEAFMADNELEGTLSDAQDLLEASLCNNSIDSIINSVNEEIDAMYASPYGSRSIPLIASKSTTPDTGMTNYLEYFSHIKRNINKEDPRYEETAGKGELINAVGVWRSDLSRHSFNKSWLSLSELYSKYSHVHHLDSFNGVNASIINILMKDLVSFSKIKKHKNSVTGHVYIEPTPGMYTLPMFANEHARGCESLIRLSFPRAKSAHHRRCIIPVYNTKDNTLRLCLYKVETKTDLIQDIKTYSTYVSNAVNNEGMSLSIIGLNKMSFSPEMIAALTGNQEYVLCDKHSTNTVYKGSSVGITIVPQDIKLEFVDHNGRVKPLSEFLSKVAIVDAARTSRYKPDITLDSDHILVNGEKGFSFIAGTLAVLY